MASGAIEDDLRRHPDPDEAPSAGTGKEGIEPLFVGVEVPDLETRRLLAEEEVPGGFETDAVAGRGEFACSAPNVHFEDACAGGEIGEVPVPEGIVHVPLGEFRERVPGLIVAGSLVGVWVGGWGVGHGVLRVSPWAAVERAASERNQGGISGPPSGTWHCWQSVRSGWDVRSPSRPPVPWQEEHA